MTRGAMGKVMSVLVFSYTIYHSPNAYLGTILLRRARAAVPGVELVRRPFYIPARARPDNRGFVWRQGKK